MADLTKDINHVVLAIFGFWMVYRTIHSPFGPVVGAATVIGLENKPGDIGNWLARASGVEGFGKSGDAVTVVTGLIFEICVLLFRRGIMGELQALWKRMF
jgi:ABC-type branched-subunit amino acid transport system permease subunit